MKKYNIINNSLGWLCFIIAATTYLLTLEPTASFWDCPEFIAQGYKLEIGHPPGNPIFMLAARFFINFVGGDPANVAIAVNAMSALLSAATILLLFWTVTHLVKRLIIKDDANEISWVKMCVIFGSGLCGALAYTWSDTFWFSAVEGEVYAFSSFCTALVFWLILKWENRADNPRSDRYLILIAYVIGISVAVHLLNLLCIPAIVLVMYFRKFKNTNAKGALIALGISFAIVVAILYGLVPGFIEVAQYFEIFAVNTLGMSYNSGVLIYAILVLGLFLWTIYELYTRKSSKRDGLIKTLVVLCVTFSGIPLIGDSKLWPVLIIAGLVVYFVMSEKMHTRILNLTIMSIFVIFIGYSSYALILIRANANTPMNQNAPDNVFELASYLNREQYGKTPLFYGANFAENADGSIADTYLRDENGSVIENEKLRYYKSNDGKSYVKLKDPVNSDAQEDPAVKRFFPRMYSTNHVSGYKYWSGYNIDNANEVRLDDGVTTVFTPTFRDNLRYFFSYQLNHMYWRYFMWNFAGRQNDIQGNGEPNRGNWISGIPFVDNARLGDQSLLPEEYGEGNKGHNVFYMLPLILGLIGALWQAFSSRRGIEQFWVVFFLFFMTGIAIVLYLNQYPNQPRERDYAFAGSFYAFAIWIGIGVAGLWALIKQAITSSQKTKNATSVSEDENDSSAKSIIPMAIAVLVGIALPLQMVSQTWDDHDRSGRYVARDFGMNYLSSLDENAIIFTNGDNDTFPLWYAQEVEGYRTDVRVVNLSYLSQDWYAKQQLYPSYDAPAIAMQAKPEQYMLNRFSFAYLVPKATESNAVSKFRYPEIDSINTNTDAVAALNLFYKEQPLLTFIHPELERPYELPYPYITSDLSIPVNVDVATQKGRIGRDYIYDEEIGVNLGRKDVLMFHELMSLDMIATSFKNGWDRPIYFAMTVPGDYYLGLQPYLYNTGMAYEVQPRHNGTSSESIDAEKMYRNITERFRWGGLENVTASNGIYLDETIRRMVTTTRATMAELAGELISEGKFDKAREILHLMEEKLPEEACAYPVSIAHFIASRYHELYDCTGDADDNKRALKFDNMVLKSSGDMTKYLQTLSPMDQLSAISQEDLQQAYILFTCCVNNIQNKLRTSPKIDIGTEEYEAIEYASSLAIGDVVYLQQLSKDEIEHQIKTISNVLSRTEDEAQYNKLMQDYSIYSYALDLISAHEKAGIDRKNIFASNGVNGVNPTQVHYIIEQFR